jgi:hypothetical protein
MPYLLIVVVNLGGASITVDICMNAYYFMLEREPCFLGMFLQFLTSFGESVFRVLGVCVSILDL